MSEPVTSIQTPVRLDYTYAAGRASRRFLEGIANRRILGQRCSSCKRVYVPARGSCPRCAVPTEESVEAIVAAVNRLQADPQLTHRSGRYRGSLVFPYGYGVVLSWSIIGPFGLRLKRTELAAGD